MAKKEITLSDKIETTGLRKLVPLEEVQKFIGILRFENCVCKKGKNLICFFCQSMDRRAGPIMINQKGGDANGN